MLIKMWGTGELRREFKVLEHTVYMRITRPLEPTAIPACILLDNAYAYYPLSTDELWANMPLYKALACDHLRLPEDLSSIRRFVDYIQDGFEEMFKTLPEEQDRDKQVYGEMTASLGGARIVREVSR